MKKLHYDLGKEYTMINISWKRERDGDPFFFIAEDKKTMENYNIATFSKPYYSQKNVMQFEAKGIVEFRVNENAENLKITKDVRGGWGTEVFPTMQ